MDQLNQVSILTVCCVLRSILILFFHVRLGLQSCLFPSRFQTVSLYIFLILPMLHAKCPSHPILLDLDITNYPSPTPRLFITFSLHGLNILHSSIKDQISCPYKTSGKITSCVLLTLTSFR